jgi:hypothetical protein
MDPMVIALIVYGVIAIVIMPIVGRYGVRNEVGRHNKSEFKPLGLALMWGIGWPVLVLMVALEFIPMGFRWILTGQTRKEW